MREKPFLFVLFSVVALASGGGLTALDHFGILSLDTVAETATESAEAQVPALGSMAATAPLALKGALLTSAVAAPAPQGAAALDVTFEEPVPPAERFAYLPANMPLSAEALAQDAADETDEATLEQAALSSESENPDTWVSEMRREVAALESKTVGGAALRPRSVLSEQAMRKSLDDRLAQISPAAGVRLREKFAKAKVAWPPAEVSLIAIKDERVVELHARDAGNGGWHFVHSYKVLAASGGAGPKLKRGDRQVPEGVYQISFLNPNSRYHVSMRVNFPNQFDREMATKDGRTDLGGDIMIHGKNVSAGCLAVGDEAAEELFVLSARIGLQNLKVIIAPTDLRKSPPPQTAEGQPHWLPQLYTQVASAMAPYERPSSGLLSFFGN